MNKKNHTMLRDNIFILLLNKMIREYKGLLAIARREKPFKIIEVMHLSAVPGETQFAIQVTNKNCILHLTAAEIIEKQYELNDFNDFHSNMIRHAARGTIIEFLKASDKDPQFKIITKKYDKLLKQYCFTIETTDQVRFTRTSHELSHDKRLLCHMDLHDVYDIGYTQGCQSVLNEKVKR